MDQPQESTSSQGSQTVSSASPSQQTLQPESKSSHTKLIIGVLVVLAIVVVGIAGYQIYMNKSSSLYEDASLTRKSTPMMKISPTPTTGMVKSGDTQIDAESEAIDANLKQLDSDVVNVDSGLQDQSVNLNE